MRTENKYEEMLIKEIRGLPKISQYKIVQMLRTLRHRKKISNNKENSPVNVSGLCGIWKDSRDADVIIDDIQSARTGFGDRDISL